MYTLASCTITIQRPSTGSTPLGDPTTTYTQVATGVPASIVEDSRRTWDQATQTPRTVRWLSALVGSATNVQKGDRIRDDTNGGVLYVVKDVTQERSFGYTPDLELDLGRVGKGQ